MCLQNGGIYTKFGQQLATLNHALPREYIDTLSQLQDRARAVPFAVAMRTVESELQLPWQQAFHAIDREPLAAASLAQVHRAVDRTGRSIAVKIQYPHLAQQMSADLAVIKWGFRLTEYLFPDVHIAWIFPEFEAALRAELDFEREKNNSRRIADMLAHNKSVHIPLVYDELSTKRVLTMEFIEGCKISDVEGIQAIGIEPREAATTLCEVFGEMIFSHGFVHCDPHPGNVFVRRNQDPSASTRAQLVLLDHGLYRELDEDFRTTYCDLWRAMILRDDQLMETCGQRLGVGSMVNILPLLLTYRSIDSRAPLGARMSKAERRQLAKELRQVQLSDVTDFLQTLPRDMLFVFRTTNMIRSLNKELGGSTRERFAIMGKCALDGHRLRLEDMQKESRWMLLDYWHDHARMIFHLKVVDWALRALQLVRGNSYGSHKSG